MRAPQARPFNSLQHVKDVHSSPVEVALVNLRSPDGGREIFPHFQKTDIKGQTYQRLARSARCYASEGSPAACSPKFCLSPVDLVWRLRRCQRLRSMTNSAQL